MIFDVRYLVCTRYSRAFTSLLILKEPADSRLRTFFNILGLDVCVVFRSYCMVEKSKITRVFGLENVSLMGDWSICGLHDVNQPTCGSTICTRHLLSFLMH